MMGDIIPSFRFDFSKQGHGLGALDFELSEFGIDVGRGVIPLFGPGDFIVGGEAGSGLLDRAFQALVA